MSELFGMSPYRNRKCRPCHLPEDLRSFASPSGKFQPAPRSESVAVGARESSRDLVSPKPLRIWESEWTPSAAPEQRSREVIPVPRPCPGRQRWPWRAAGWPLATRGALEHPGHWDEVFGVPHTGVHASQVGLRSQYPK